MKHFHEEFALVFRRLVRGSERAVQNGKAKLGARCSTGRGQWCVMFPEARAFPRKRARVSGKTRRTRDVGEYKKGDDERARDTEEKPRRVWKTSAKCRHQKKRTLGEENPRQSSQSSLPLRARRCVKKPLLETPLCLRFAARRRSTCGRCAKATFSCGSWRRWACSFSASSTVSLTASDFLNFEIYVVETTHSRSHPTTRDVNKARSAPSRELCSKSESAFDVAEGSRERARSVEKRASLEHSRVRIVREWAQFKSLKDVLWRWRERERERELTRARAVSRQRSLSLS